jgi:hypothetical protein
LSNKPAASGSGGGNPDRQNVPSFGGSRKSANSTAIVWAA